MKKILFICFCLAALPALSSAQQHEFAEDSDTMLNQMLSPSQFGESRSFVPPKHRAIAVRKKNTQGEVETVQVNVSEDTINKGAKLKVEFDVNSSNLRPSAYTLLQELGIALKDSRVAESQICIKGHTDSDGSESYNMQLSYNRAYSVMNYLQGGAGIDPHKLKVFGYGEHLPLVSNTNGYNKQLNRRVEVSLNCPESNISQ